MSRSFRLHDPSGQCALANTNRVFKEIDATTCPCGVKGCPSNREYVSFISAITHGFAPLLFGILGTLAAVWLLLVLWGGENELSTALDQLGSKSSALETEIQSLETSAMPETPTSTADLSLVALERRTLDLQDQTEKALETNDLASIKTTQEEVHQHAKTLEALLAAPEVVSKNGGSVVLAQRLSKETEALKREATEKLESLFTKYPSEITRAETFLGSLDRLQDRVNRFTTPSSPEAQASLNRDQAALQKLNEQMRELQQKLPPQP